MREPQVKPTWKDDRWARRLGRGHVVLRLEVERQWLPCRWDGRSWGRFVGWRGRLQRGRGRCPGREAPSAVANAGWARWPPMNVVGIVAHLVGAVGVRRW